MIKKDKTILMSIEYVSKLLILSPAIWLIIIGIALFTTYFFTKLNQIEINETFNRYSSIDGLRGFLALSVFVHHLIVNYSYSKIHIWQAPKSSYQNEFGQAAVCLFFMITAFLFTRKIQNDANINWPKLYIGRFFRLVPLYTFVTALVILFALAMTGFSIQVPISVLLKSILCWIFFTVNQAPDINAYQNTNIIVAGVTWTLCYEWIFYLLLPCIAILISKRSRKTVVLALINAMIVFWLCSYVFVLQKIIFVFGAGFLVSLLIKIDRFNMLCKKPMASIVAIIALLVPVLLSYSAFNIFAVFSLMIFFFSYCFGQYHFWNSHLETMCLAG